MRSVLHKAGTFTKLRTNVCARHGAELHPVRNSRQPSVPVAEMLIRKIPSGANTADFLLPVVMFIRTQCAERRCDTTRGRAHEQLDDGTDRHLRPRRIGERLR